MYSQRCESCARAKCSGGYGLYKGGAIWGIVVDGELFVKESDQVRALIGNEIRRFTYERDGKTVEMSYIEVPGELLEDSGLMREIVESALAARWDEKKNKNAS
jgi:TfoX/Sxy family transcriptional regulator of competence genes